MSSSVTDKDKGWSKFFENVRQIGGARVKVGVLSDTEKGGMHETDPETGKSSPLTVAEIAVVNEFGTEDGHVPARPFLQPTFDREVPKLTAASQKLIWKVLANEITVEQALSILGMSLSSEVKKAILSNTPPPNAPSTAIAKAMKGRTAKFFKQKKARHVGDAIADAAMTQYVEGLGGHGRGGRKGIGAARTIGDAFAQIGAVAAVKTLIDTGRMLNAVTYAVKLKGDEE